MLIIACCVAALALGYLNGGAWSAKAKQGGDTATCASLSVLTGGLIGLGCLHVYLLLLK